ncbi:FecR family protein [Daejeonella sp.]|jgi:ferric-dicitrate binding protein FerR (iron transport regulator)|uniref:FecR family protein n=1 Tax=Daejeonella sp. TaxID=2805397 RepID=UPI0037BEDEFF
MTRKEYNRLYEKYLAGKCSKKEQAELENYQDSFELKEQQWNVRSMGNSEEIKQSIQEDLNYSIQEHSKYRIFRFRAWQSAAAAAILILLTAGIYYYQNSPEPVLVKTETPRFRNDVAPGNNKAILTLDDGSKIDLDDAKTGILANESNIDIKKTGDGQLEYTAGAQNVKTVKYNILSTPMGGEYQLVLPDGSKVWLNSGSTLRFPTAFIGSERIVELKGEAYFDIAKNPKMPFLVRTNNAMDIKVLGTQFNIMAYDDEKNINTTLIEGSVEVLKGSGKTMLKPGQEAILNRGSGNIKVASADLEQAIAWKNGYFIFYNENIESIMRKVSRWYNVDVVYQGNLSNKDFVGTISRNKNISELLKMLELTGAVHFSIDGRRITVMP